MRYPCIFTNVLFYPEVYPFKISIQDIQIVIFFISIQDIHLDIHQCYPIDNTYLVLDIQPNIISEPAYLNMDIGEQV
jgi:hypothetical protein